MYLYLSNSLTSTNNPMEEPLTFRLPAGERQRLKKRQAQELFATLHEEPFERVEISGCALPHAAATVAASGLSALAKKRCLRDLVISDCIAGLAPDEALQTLTALCEGAGADWKGLRSVDLSSNALGSRGVAACAAVLMEQPLEEVYMSNNGLAAASVRMVHANLCARGDTQLRVLHCTLNCVHSEGMAELARVVAQSPRLEQLRLSSLRAGADAVTKLCEVLAKTDRLRLLDLSDNGFNADTARALGVALKKQTALEALMLRDLALPPQQMRDALSPLLEANAPVVTLDVSGNELEQAPGGRLLAELLRSLASSLRSLYAADNALGAAGVKPIVKTLEEIRPPALRIFSLASNGLCDLPVICVAEQVLQMKRFESLDIDANTVSDAVVYAMKEHMEDVLAPTDGMVSDDEDDEEDEDDDPFADDNVAAALVRLAEAAASPSNGRAPVAAGEVSETSTAPDVGSEVSFETPASRLDGERLTEQRDAPASPSSREEVYSSARKLNRDLADIRDSLTGFVAELNEVKEAAPRTLSFDDDDEVEKRDRSGVLDIVGGFMVALFVVLLMLSIAKSQEENSFTYRPV